MEDKKRKPILMTFCFRADPEFIDLFHAYCTMNNITRSEGFRNIFNEHIINKYFKTPQHETNDLKHNTECR